MTICKFSSHCKECVVSRRAACALISLLKCCRSIFQQTLRCSFNQTQSSSIEWPLRCWKRGQRQEPGVEKQNKVCKFTFAHLLISSYIYANYPSADPKQNVLKRNMIVICNKETQRQVTISKQMLEKPKSLIPAHPV